MVGATLDEVGFLQVFEPQSSFLRVEVCLVVDLEIATFKEKRQCETVLALP